MPQPNLTDADLDRAARAARLAAAVYERGAGQAEGSALPAYLKDEAHRLLLLASQLEQARHDIDT